MLRDLFQSDVARIMTIGVIDGFEMIDIHHHDCSGWVFFEGGLGFVQKADTVVQLRQGIGFGQVSQFVLQLRLSGHDAYHENAKGRTDLISYKQGFCDVVWMPHPRKVSDPIIKQGKARHQEACLEQKIW